jgi:hypothetical protein
MFALTGGISYPTICSFLNKFQSDTSQVVISNLQNIQLLIVFNNPQKNIEFSIGLNLQDGKVYYDSESLKKIDLAFLVSFIDDLLLGNTTDLSIIASSISNNLISNLLGCRFSFCLQALIKALQCFPNYPLLYSFAANEFNYYINTPLNNSLFYNVNNKLVVNINQFPGTLFFSQTTTSICSGTSVTNRAYITFPQSNIYLTCYVKSNFENDDRLISFAQTLPDCIVFLEYHFNEKETNKSYVLLLNLTAKALYYYINTPYPLIELLLKIISDTLKIINRNENIIQNIIKNFGSDIESEIISIIGILNEWRNDKDIQSLLPSFVSLIIKGAGNTDLFGIFKDLIKIREEIDVVKRKYEKEYKEMEIIFNQAIQEMNAENKDDCKFKLSQILRIYEKIKDQSKTIIASILVFEFLLDRYQKCK